MYKMIRAVSSQLTKMTELNDDVTKMADILNLNENLNCIILLLILGHLENGYINFFNLISDMHSPLKYARA